RFRSMESRINDKLQLIDITLKYRHGLSLEGGGGYKIPVIQPHLGSNSISHPSYSVKPRF
ncbi:MAG: hypothetical protein NTW80_10630, partial [Deltaproteobacteria bacterium]|nr:hypothetical protein [Deltaproteobacteria bacterium]